MPRTGTRITVGKGIYRDGDNGPYEIRVVVGGQAYYDRLPPDSTPDELITARAALHLHGQTQTPKANRWTLAHDAKAYLRLVAHLASKDDREDHLNAWLAAGLGELPRHRITPQHVQAARVTWLGQGKAPKTINHYVGTLRNLYHRLDGKRAATPCDDIEDLPVPKTMIRRVPDALILKVDRTLQERERDPSKSFDGAKTRARFRVFVSTGKRPCEIMRAKPEDVNLKARVWVPRDAKGGYCPGVYLNEDMLEAWKLFIKADAWGAYNHGNFGRVIRNAGWPKDLKPYQARHTMWQAASERGIDLRDISTGAGHKDMRLTGRVYVPVLNSRLQRMSETMDGRFRKWPQAKKAR